MDGWDQDETVGLLFPGVVIYRVLSTALPRSCSNISIYSLPLLSLANISPTRLLSFVSVLSLQPVLSPHSSVFCLTSVLCTLEGEIPASWGTLSKLRVLDLSVTSVRGRIPAQLGDLVNLKELLLSSTKLEGRVPPELGNLKCIETLMLAHTNLEGE